MDAQFLARTKQADVEREIARLRLIAAAKGHHAKPAPAPETRLVRQMPLRVLHALRLVS